MSPPSFRDLPRPLPTLASVRQIDFKRHVDHRGSLVPIEGGADVPFEIKRLFYVHPRNAGESRGKHGHFRCSQLLICVSGACRIVVQDGRDQIECRLDRRDRGLFIPPTLWAEEIYETVDTVLLVLCDRHFEADDYISDFEEFMALRTLGEGG